MEHCEGGDLDNMLRSRQGQLMSEDELMRYFVQIAFALSHVHSKSIVHRDLKTNNVFLTSAGILKVPLHIYK